MLGIWRSARQSLCLSDGGDFKMDTLGNATLSFLFFPMICGLALFLFRKNQLLAQWANLVFNVLWAAMFVRLWQMRPTEGSAFQNVYFWNWLPFIKSHFSLALDALNLPLIGLTVFLSTSLAFFSLGKKNLSAAFTP